MQEKYKLLITGTAGFIGFHLADFFCKKEWAVTGIDNVNDYYDTDLKNKRLELLSRHAVFSFRKIDICDKASLDALFEEERFDIVINLAAQAGVRYSIDQPYKYIDSNLIGFINVLEACRSYPVMHLVFASSSSVYGNNTEIPFSTDQKTDSPVSLYAATKKANELMAYSYAHLYHIPMTGLRFFTVYGPWGRPDMAYFHFTRNIFNGTPIHLFNQGKMKRDFTYIDDVVISIDLLLHQLSKQDFQWKDKAEAIQIFNIGNNQPVELMEFVLELEQLIGQKAAIELYPMQSGDVVETYADIDPLKQVTGFSPSTKINIGLKHFVDWYKSYYQ